MDILCLGQQNWDHCWTGKQQLTSRLAERGHRVLYVDPDFPPVEDDARIRAASMPGVSGLRRRGPGDLFTWTYLPVRPLGWRVNVARQPRMLPAVLARLGFVAPTVLCLHPKQSGHLARVDPQALVYYAVDEYTAYEGMAEEEKRRVRAQEDAILASADRVLAVSEGLRRRFAESNPAAFVLENGSDAEHYAPEKLARIARHPDLPAGEGPVIGFIGQVDSRIDDALVAAVAESRPDWTFAFAGRRTPTPLPRMEARPNVRFLGYTPYEQLPSVAAGVDVWTVPYVESDITHACNPLKVYEYLATGKPIVSRPLDGIEICRDVLTLARDSDAFRDGIAAALADPEAGRANRIARAEANDWYARVETLEAHLEAAVAHARDTGRWIAAHTPLARASRVAAAPAYDTLRARDEYGAPRPPRAKRPRAWRAALAGSRALGALIAPGRAARSASRAEPKRILVARHGHLGDFVALQPMLAHLRRAWPHAHVTLGVDTGSIAPALYTDAPEIDEIREIDFAPWRIEASRPERLRRWLSLVAGRYDLMVNGASWFFLSEGHLAGAPQVAGIYDGHPLQGLQGRLLRRDRFRHDAENNLALAEALTGMPAPPDARRPQVHVDRAAARVEADGVLAARGIPVERRLLLVHPGSKLPSRRWPLPRLAEAIARVLDAHPEVDVVLTGTAGERPLAEEVHAALPARLGARVHDCVGATGLPGLVGLIDRAAAVLSNDTGIMHLARARGAPLAAILGPENDLLWGPHPEGEGPAIALRREVPCAPCRWDACAAHWCLRSIGVDDVVEAVGRLLDRDDGGARNGALQLDRRRLSWSQLARAGFAIPQVAVLVDEDGADGGDLRAVLPMIERQTYPAIEIVRARPGAAADADAREPARRRALPIRSVPREGLQAALATADLVVAARPGMDWAPAHLAREVAAAARIPGGLRQDG